MLNSAHSLYVHPISAPRKCLIILTSAQGIFLSEIFSILLIRSIVFNRILYCCHFCHLLERIKAVLPRQSHLSTVTSFLMSIQVSKWVLQCLKWWTQLQRLKTLLSCTTSSKSGKKKPPWLSFIAITKHSETCLHDWGETVCKRSILQHTVWEVWAQRHMPILRLDSAWALQKNQLNEELGPSRDTENNNKRTNVSKK